MRLFNKRKEKTPVELSALKRVLTSIDEIKNTPVDDPDWPQWKKDIWLNVLYGALPMAAESDELFHD